MPKPKQLPSHVGLVTKMKLQKQIKEAFIKGDMTTARKLREQLSNLGKKK